MQKTSLKIPKYSLTLFVTSILVYIPALFNRYASDDIVYILDNPLVKDIANWKLLFFRSTLPAEVYRPLGVLSFLITYSFFQFEPWVHHSINILLHAGTTVFVYLLVAKVFEDKSNIQRFAFYTALLFSVLPIHCEAVAALATRTELMCSFFSLATLYFALESSKDSGVAEGAARNVFVFICFLCAVFSKESAFCLFLLIPLVFLTRFRIAKAISNSIIPLFSISLGAALYFYLRAGALGGLIEVGYQRSELDNPLLNLNALDRLINALCLLGRYLFLAVIPWRLNADYSFGEIEIVKTVFQPEVFFYLLALLSLIIIIIYGMFYNKVLAFFGTWFLAAFFVTSNILFPMGTIFGERLCYLPSIGVCGLLAHFIGLINRQKLRKSVRNLIVLFYSLKSFISSFDLRDNQTLFTHQVIVSPNSAKSQSNFGVLLAYRGEKNRAVDHYIQAIKIFRAYGSARHNLASIYLEQGRVADAEKLLYEQLEIEPNNLITESLLGRLYFNRGDLEKSHDIFRKILLRDATNMSALIGSYAIFAKKILINQSNKNNLPDASLPANEEKQLKNIERRILEIEPNNKEFIRLRGLLNQENSQAKN